MSEEEKRERIDTLQAKMVDLEYQIREMDHRITSFKTDLEDQVKRVRQEIEEMTEALRRP